MPQVQKSLGQSGLQKPYYGQSWRHIRIQHWISPLNKLKHPRICRIFFSYSAVWTYSIKLYLLALLSKRCNFVKMIATRIFMGTIIVENFMQNIFCDPTFFSKVHILRENREKLTLSSFQSTSQNRGRMMQRHPIWRWFIYLVSRVHLRKVTHMWLPLDVDKFHLSRTQGQVSNRRSS